MLDFEVLIFSLLNKDLGMHFPRFKRKSITLGNNNIPSFYHHQTATSLCHPRSLLSRFSQCWCAAGAWAMIPCVFCHVAQCYRCQQEDWKVRQHLSRVLNQLLIIAVILLIIVLIVQPLPALLRVAT